MESVLPIAPTQLKGRGQGSSLLESLQVSHMGTGHYGERQIWRGKLKKPTYEPKVTQVIKGQITASLILFRALEK